MHPRLCSESSRVFGLCFTTRILTCSPHPLFCRHRAFGQTTTWLSAIPCKLLVETFEDGKPIKQLRNFEIAIMNLCCIVLLQIEWVNTKVTLFTTEIQLKKFYSRFLERQIEFIQIRHSIMHDSWKMGYFCLM